MPIFEASQPLIRCLEFCDFHHFWKIQSRNPVTRSFFVRKWQKIFHAWLFMCSFHSSFQKFCTLKGSFASKAAKITLFFVLIRNVCCVIFQFFSDIGRRKTWFLHHFFLAYPWMKNVCLVHLIFLFMIYFLKNGSSFTFGLSAHKKIIMLLWYRTRTVKIFLLEKYFLFLPFFFK